MWGSGTTTTVPGVTVAEVVDEPTPCCEPSEGPVPQVQEVGEANEMAAERPVPFCWASWLKCVNHGPPVASNRM